MTRVVGLWLVSIVAFAPPAGALAPSPFEVTLASPLGTGRGVEIRAGLRADAARVALAGNADVYVMRTIDWPSPLLYLDAAGRWSTAPAAHRRDAPVPSLAPVLAAWSETGPPGEITLVAIVVRPGGDPQRRDDWLFQPFVDTVRVRGPFPLARGILELAALGLATLGALVVVTRFGRSSAGPFAASARP